MLAEEHDRTGAAFADCTESYFKQVTLWLASGSEAAAALVIGLRALRECRLVVGDAVLDGLGFKVAAALLKTIELRSWDQIAAFAAILALRSLLKFALSRERARLSDA